MRSHPGKPLSGLNWTIPKGTCAPGYVFPVKSVPIKGLTQSAKHSAWPSVPAGTQAVNEHKNDDKLKNRPNKLFNRIMIWG